jgi:prophage regulatory protein
MRILRNKEVRRKTGLSNSSMYELISADQFPAAIALGDRSVGWVEEEIDAWITERIAKRDRALATKAPATDTIEPAAPKKRGRPRKQRVAEQAATIAA